MAEFADRLLSWFDRHGRKDLPWQVADPYRVWVSEVMLQQTQVRTVIPYYERFIRRFPDVATLAGAPVDAVLEHWSGLGYYARARNLHAAARIINKDHGGRCPADRETLESLPGIGRSTAGAILALSFGQRHPILDGNAKRVLARHAAVGGWPGKADTARRLWELADHHTPSERVADYTQAIMDLGATVCTRSNPDCTACPVQDDCAALAEGNVPAYPGRKARKDKPLRKTTMLLAVAGDAVLLERRPPSGIWGGLWSFPEIDGTGTPAWAEDRTRAVSYQRQEWPTLRHSFTHFDLDIRPVVVHLAEAASGVEEGNETVWYRLDDPPPGGIAAPVRKLLDTLKETRHVANG